MVITTTSNINGFLDKFRRKSRAITDSIKEIATRLAEVMSEDMAIEISSLKYIWEEDLGGMSNLPPIDFQITPIGNTEVVVMVGKHMPRLKMKDGTYVNPAYFIEFGFGIVGQEDPKKGYKEYDWEYNVNDHDKAWYFRGKDGSLQKSAGREGINFMYNTIQKYKDKWKDLFIELVKEKSL